MRKGQNECALTFGIGACGEEFGFSPEVTFFSPLTHPLSRWKCSQVVPHCCREALIVFWEFILKLCRKNKFFLNFFRKNSTKKISEALKRVMFFSDGLPSCVEKRVQKVGSKFKGSARGANEERAKWVCYNLWHWGLRGRVRFLSKSNLIYLPQDIPWVSRSAPK